MCQFRGWRKKIFSFSSSGLHQLIFERLRQYPLVDNGPSAREKGLFIPLPVKASHWTGISSFTKHTYTVFFNPIWSSVRLFEDLWENQCRPFMKSITMWQEVLRKCARSCANTDRRDCYWVLQRIGSKYLVYDLSIEKPIHFTFTAETSLRLLSERSISLIFKNKTHEIQSGKKYTGDAKAVGIFFMVIRICARSHTSCTSSHFAPF